MISAALLLRLRVAVCVLDQGRDDVAQFAVGVLGQFGKNGERLVRGAAAVAHDDASGLFDDCRFSTAFCMCPDSVAWVWYGWALARPTAAKRFVGRTEPPVQRGGLTPGKHSLGHVRDGLGQRGAGARAYDHQHFIVNFRRAVQLWPSTDDR